MKIVPRFLSRASFSVKLRLVMLLAVVSLLAASLIFVAFLSRRTAERQLYLIQNNYDQVRSNLEEKVASVYNSSTMITVNEEVNRALSDAGDMDMRSQLSAFEQISSHARTIEMGNSQISIYFFLDDSLMVVQERSTRYRPISSFWDSDLGKALEYNHGYPVWGVADESVEHSQGGLALARELSDQHDYTRTLGVLLISLHEKQVQTALNSVLPGQYLGIYRDDGVVCASNGVALPAEFSFSSDSTGGELREDGKFLYCSAQLSDTDLYLVSLLPKALVAQGTRYAQRNILVLYLLVFGVTGLLLFPLTGGMVRDIRQLRRQLEDVPEHGLRKLSRVNLEDEIGRLVTAYNGIVDEMQHMLQVQYDLGRAKAGAELKALQSQINPHFLYNTLDMVSWMAVRKEMDNIQQVMQALSKFYKLTLSGGQDIITLDQELQLCAAFMSIQQMRWTGAIDYIVEVDDELLPARIPKITLQPLIENAIKHGIMQRGEARGSIIVGAISEEINGKPYMLLSVLDNGVGMKDCQEEMNKGSGSHYGMKNIEMRLSLYYEEEIHIQVDSEADLGTCVTLKLPVVTEEKDHEA